MKRALLVSCALLAVLLASCVSAPRTVDRGIYNPKSAPESDMAVLNIHEYIDVLSLDGSSVNWSTPDKKLSPQVVRIPAGVHVFEVRYHTGSVSSVLPIKVIGQFEKGKEYVILGNVMGNRVSIDIVDKKAGESVLLDLGKQKGEDPGVLSTYIKYVLNPTMDEVGNSVRLENEDFVILYKPDMLYSMTDKKTGATVEGRRGFQMDFRMKAGKAYLLETDVSKMTKEQFLDSDYAETAQIVWVPVKCSKDSVTYRYERPESLKGREATFSVTEIRK